MPVWPGLPYRPAGSCEPDQSPGQDVALADSLGRPARVLVAMALARCHRWALAWTRRPEWDPPHKDPRPYQKGRKRRQPDCENVDIFRTGLIAWPINRAHHLWSLPWATDGWRYRGPTGQDEGKMDLSRVFSRDAPRRGNQVWQVSASEIARAQWRKSSLSTFNGSCVEIARLRSDRVGIRDTKDKGSGPILIFTENEWQAFLGGARGGEFDSM